MHAFITKKQRQRYSLPPTSFQQRTAEASNVTVSRSDSKYPATEQALKKKSSLPTHPTHRRRYSEIPQPAPESTTFLARLQQAFRRPTSFAVMRKRHSMGPLPRQLMTGLSENPKLIELTHDHTISTESFQFAALLPATHSMTCTGNPIPPMSPRSASEASNSSSSTSASSSSSSSSASYRIPLKIRDFTYAAPDPRHQGLGEDGRGTLNVPRANRVRVIYKVLLDEAGYRAWKAAAVGSDRDSPDSDETDVDEDAEGDQDDDDDAAHWPLAHWPSAGEADAEFDDDDDEEEEENESGPLSPGLYRALYAFEPEGSREMALQEQQIVRVVGRGGGVGWAVVVVDGVDEQGKKRMSQKDRQLALVPEGYLEPIALDEDETS